MKRCSYRGTALLIVQATTCLNFFNTIFAQIPIKKLTGDPCTLCYQVLNPVYSKFQVYFCFLCRSVIIYLHAWTCKKVIIVTESIHQYFCGIVIFHFFIQFVEENYPSIHYDGRGPVVPNFSTTCTNCNRRFTFKMNVSGIE